MRQNMDVGKCRPNKIENENMKSDVVRSKIFKNVTIIYEWWCLYQSNGFIFVFVNLKWIEMFMFEKKNKFCPVSHFNFLRFSVWNVQKCLLRVLIISFVFQFNKMCTVPVAAVFTVVVVSFLSLLLLLLFLFLWSRQMG